MSKGITVEEFRTLLEGVGSDLEEVQTVRAMWRKDHDDTQWEGGVLLLAIDGRYEYVVGWNDVDGDGSSRTETFGFEPHLIDLKDYAGVEAIPSDDWILETGELNQAALRSQ